MNIGLIHVDQGQFDRAEAAYRTALDLQPDFTQAAVNLADLYRIQGREGEGEKTLRQALALDPPNAAAHHALGLWLIRQKRLPEALTALAEAARLSGDNPRYGYVYAVALNERRPRPESDPDAGNDAGDASQRPRYAHGAGGIPARRGKPRCGAKPCPAPGDLGTGQSRGTGAAAAIGGKLTECRKKPCAPVHREVRPARLWCRRSPLTSLDQKR